MLYGAECWPTKRRHMQQLSVAEMRMLRWFCGHTWRDRVRNEVIRDKVGVAQIEEKFIQHRITSPDELLSYRICLLAFVAPSCLA